MRESHRWSLTATVGFGLTGFGVAVVWAVVGLYVTSPETLGDGLTAADLAVVDPVLTVIVGVVATVAGALVGGPAWAVLVERWDRWSIPRRGALAGACTGFLAVPVAFALFSPAFGPPNDPTIPDVLVLGFVVGLLALLAVGWTTIPAGAAAGYVLGLRRAGDLASTWHRVAERLL